MKKIISIVMAIVLVATSAIALSATVFAESKLNLTLESKTIEVSYDEDATITLALKLTNNPGIASFMCDLKYDKDVFTLVKTVNGDVFPSSDPDCIFDNKVSMMWTYGPMDEVNITRDGTLATFTFTVSKDAPAGDYTIRVNPLLGGFADVVGDPVSAEYTNATISVKKPPVEVSGVTLDKTSADMYVGDTLTLVATVSPANATDKTVTWKSSDTSVATVDANGVVSALKEGNVTITATAGKKSATCKISATVKPCEHTNKTFHDAKDSTCKDKGWDAYYSCNDCPAVFDAEGKQISGVPFRALADHTAEGGKDADCENSAVCGVCGKSFGDALGHDFTKEEAEAKYLVKAATCDSYAVYYKSCARCGKASTETFEYVAGGFDADNHCGETYLKDDKAATETEEGYTGDTHCKGCDKLLKAGTVIAKLPHEAGDIVPGVKSTCSTHGTSAYYVCNNCGGKFFDKDCTQKVENDEALVLPLDPTNHTGETEVRGFVAPTEETAGYTGDTYCKDCGELIATGKVIDKLVHTPVLVEEVKANCHAEGTKAYYHCDNCGKNFSDEEGTLEIADMAELVIAIDADNHDGGTEVKDAVAATVDKEGYSGDTYCKGCGALLEKGEAIAKLPAPTEEKKDDTKTDDTTAAGSPDSVPSTGDEFSVVVFVLLALASTGALGFVVTTDRKKRRA